MKERIKYLREMDKILGDICCTLLAVNKVFRKKKALDTGKIKRILLIKFWGFGSLLLMTPSIRALKNKYPKAKLTILTLEQNRHLCERIRFIDEIITVSIKSTARALNDIAKTLEILRKKEFDVSIDFEFFVGVSAIITYLSGAYYKIGFRSGRIHSRNSLYDKAVLYNKKKHITENFANLVRPLGVRKVDYVLEKLKTTQKDRRYLSVLLKKAGITGKDKLVCMNINAGELAFERRWPKDRFVELAKRIIKNYPNAKIVFIGNGKDKEYVKSALATLGNKGLINFAGKLDIPQLQILFEKSDLFITNDSGPMHLAAATQTNSICLFGPETPQLYAPLNRNSRVVYKKLKCSPCMDVYNRKKIICHNGAECMKKITVGEVLGKVKSVLK